MSWFRRHLVGLVALVVLLAAAVAYGFYGPWKFAETQEPFRTEEVGAGDTARRTGGEVRLLDVKEHQSLPSYGDEPASHPPRTKFVLARFEATMPSRKAIREWSAPTVELRDGDRTWTDSTFLDLADPSTETGNFGGGLDEEWRPGRTYRLTIGFVVPTDVDDYTVDLTFVNSKDPATRLRFLVP